MNVESSSLTPQTSGRPRRSLAVAMLTAGLWLSGCQTSTGPQDSANTVGDTPVLRQGYTCCNLHHENHWVSDANYASLPMIPLGTPTRITAYGRYRISADVNGTEMRLGLDYGRQEALSAYAAKLVVTEDPKVRLATYPTAIRRAIEAALTDEAQAVAAERRSPFGTPGAAAAIGRGLSDLAQVDLLDAHDAYH